MAAQIAMRKALGVRSQWPTEAQVRLGSGSFKSHHEMSPRVGRQILIFLLLFCFVLFVCFITK